MKPYYQDEYVTLYCGDCREIVPTLGKFDLLLTDPPYGIGNRGGTVGKSRGHKNEYAGLIDSPEYVKQVVVPIIIESLRMCNGRGIITTGYPCMFFYPQPEAVGVFYQPSTCGLCKWGRADSQPIFYYGRDPRLGKKISICSFVLTERPSCKSHPCSKPIKAWSALVDKGSLVGETILDPFAGSGTTGVAAKLLNRKCTLIEKEEKYCEIAVRRLSQGVLPLWKTEVE